MRPMDRFMARRAEAHLFLGDIDSGNIDDNREAVEGPPEILGVDWNGHEAGVESSPPPKEEATEKPLHFMGMKVRRRANLLSECHGDYIDVSSDPSLSKIPRKYGDGKVLFADKVLRFTRTGKMKRRILLITDSAVYIIDPDSDVMKRRIALAAVDKLRMSELNDNFFAIVIPSEYDCLMASTRKIEIVNVLLEATKTKSEYEFKVFRSNRFEYNAAADKVKEVEFEEVAGNVMTKFLRK
ncbi:myosin ID heavy chain [Phalaenopsis equestris]|uniref:myosin ID heavy chain n=1 Tax=Phalaenopsis equestris TaxID=78828 RepID=UPI0009E4F4DB|nr:myosin ID heavy chain [Phalaenopsis equestris]